MTRFRGFKRVIAMVTMTALALTLAVVPTGCKNDGNTLNIFTWEEYFPSEVIRDFENETGIKVNYSTFDTNEEMYSILQGKKSSYDIILCSDYIIEIMRRDGALKELDRSKLPNFRNINPLYQSQYYDPDNRYSIPYATFTAIMCYDSAKVDFPITGYADLWRPEFNNKVVLIDGDRDIIGMTLQMMGYSLNETDPNILAMAEAKLMELRPNVVKLDANVPHETMISGDAVIGYMFGSQATAAGEMIPTIEFVYPEEGLAFGLDNIVIPKEAPHPDNAHTFINYMLDGKVSAKASCIINYANTNTAATPYLTQEFINNKSCNIPDSVLQKAETFMDLGDAMVTYSDIWTKFKSGR